MSSRCACGTDEPRDLIMHHFRYKWFGFRFTSGERVSVTAFETTTQNHAFHFHLYTQFIYEF